MSSISHLNSVYINYLTPLIKWRIMDLESLRRQCGSRPNYFHFARVIRKMEKEKILSSYKHRFNGKKYLFFNSFGERQITGIQNPTGVSKDSIIHDLKVSELAMTLLESGLIDDVSLEHELQNKRNFRQTYRVIPDALLEINLGNIKQKLALELELTQKQKQRIREKAKQYMISSKYDFVIYLFPNKRMMQMYIQEIMSAVGAKYFDRFVFITDESVTTKKTNLLELDCYRANKIYPFYEFLRV